MQPSPSLEACARCPSYLRPTPMTGWQKQPSSTSMLGAPHSRPSGHHMHYNHAEPMVKGDSLIGRNHFSGTNGPRPMEKNASSQSRSKGRPPKNDSYLKGHLMTPGHSENFYDAFSDMNHPYQGKFASRQPSTSSVVGAMMGNPHTTTSFYQRMPTGLMDS